MAPQSSDRPGPEISVVLCTYNRSTLLADALAALVRQPDAPPYEIVVVDNHSTDDTGEVIESFVATGHVRSVFEPVQGLSHARNRGIATATADIIAFTDDDVRVGPAWVRSIAAAFAEHPDVDVVGGKVEPEWEADPPPWLPHAGHAPLALVDYGAEAFRIEPAHPRCLIGANLAIRRGALERVHGFSPLVQKVGNRLGSTEDHLCQMQLLNAGASALYDPRIVARAVVPRERLTKRYHRAWHRAHGRVYALMRDPLFERSKAGTVRGVPAHVYRSAIGEATAWATSLLLGRRSVAFAHELRLRFLTAFAVQRIFEQRIFEQRIFERT
jgi:glucosyl-dolichyl phosphate glucuronosyltransferase